MHDVRVARTHQCHDGFGNPAAGERTADEFSADDRRFVLIAMRAQLRGQVAVHVAAKAHDVAVSGLGDGIQEALASARISVPTVAIDAPSERRIDAAGADLAALAEQLPAPLAAGQAARQPLLLFRAEQAARLEPEIVAA